ncbi:hypothetical protein SD80_012570 [Scytonema tolypothrichoides VB-61278]|nr:hypothetical protein SD80_012570 [Scytonema tolypothrichoides VB-61278]
MDENPSRYDDALEVAKEAQRANQRIREILENPHAVTAEAMKSAAPPAIDERQAQRTTAEVMKTAQSTQPSGQSGTGRGNDQKAVKDAYEAVSDGFNLENFDISERHTEQSSEKEKPPRRTLQRAKELLAKAQGKAQEFKQQHPKATKALEIGVTAVSYTPQGRVGRVAGSVIRSLDPEDLKQAYELAKEWGRDVRVFIDQAQQKVNVEEKVSKGKPFYEIKQVERDTSLRRLEKQRDGLTRRNKGEYIENVGEVRFSHGEEIKAISKRIEDVKQQPPSIEEAISHKAHDPGLAHRISRTALNADEFGKSYLVGTPDEKYDYLLHNVVSHLGSEYFDLAKHPYRAIEFDKFAANRLYHDGFSPQEVERTIKDGAFRPLFDAKNALEAKFLPEYDQKTVIAGVYNEGSIKIHHKTSQWQQQQGSKFYEAKINPHELDQHQELIAHWAERNIEKIRDTKEQATAKLVQYNAVAGNLDDQSTKTQFLVEYGRIMASGKTLDERRLSISLMQAGHSREEIIEVLKQHSPRFNESTGRLKQELDVVEWTIKTDEFQISEVKRVEKLRKDNKLLTTERRLEKLELTDVEKEARYQQFQSNNRTQSLSRSQDDRNQEIER